MSVTTAYPTTSQAIASQALRAAFIGAGAAVLVVAPTGQTHVTFPGSANLAAARNGVAAFACVRNGAGDHSITFTRPATPAAVLNVTAAINGDTATLLAKVHSWSVSNGQLTVRVKAFIHDGTATDLAATDRLVLDIDAADTSAL